MKKLDNNFLVNLLNDKVEEKSYIQQLFPQKYSLYLVRKKYYNITITVVYLFCKSNLFLTGSINNR